MKDEEAKRIRMAMQTGRLDMDDPEVLAVSQRSSDLAKELEELRHLQKDLDREGMESRSVIQSARSAEVEDGDLRLLQEIPEIRPERAPWRTPVWAPLAVLACLFGGWMIYKSTTAEPAQASTLMGATAPLELLRPVGSQGDWSLFEWRGPEVADAWYVVYAADLDSGETFESPKIEALSWEPDWDLQGRRLQWRVVWFPGKEGERVDSENAEAQR